MLLILVSMQLLNTMKSCIESGFVISKTSNLCNSVFVSEPELKWLKQVSEFVRTGQHNYLGKVHVTGINMTQSTQPLTLLHNKVCNCLSKEQLIIELRKPFTF